MDLGAASPVTMGVIAVLLLGVAAGAGYWWMRKRRSPADAEMLPQATNEQMHAGTDEELESGEYVLQTAGVDGAMRSWVVPRDEALLYGRHEDFGKSIGTQAALSLIGSSLPMLQSTMRGGRVVRIIGPPHALRGLDSGVYQMVRTGGKALGVVRGADGKFVAQLRFGPVSKLPVLTSPPVIMLLVATAVIVTYLEQISEQLRRIERGIEELKKREEYRIMAGVQSAEDIALDLKNKLANGVMLDEPDRIQRNNAERDAKKAYAESLAQIRDYHVRVQRVADPDRRLYGKVDKKEFAALLDEGRSSRLRDATVFLWALQIRVELLQIEAMIELNREPTRVLAVRENVARKLDGMRDDYELLGETFARLNVRESSVRSNFKIKAPLDDLRDYRSATKRIRKISRISSERLLPAPPAEEEPFIIEMTEDEQGKVSARYEAIEIRPGEEGDSEAA